MNDYPFRPELHAAREELLQALIRRNLRLEFGEIEPLHGTFGLEVCGIGSQDAAKTILQVMTVQFPQWPHGDYYYVGQGADAGWRCVLQKGLEEPSLTVGKPYPVQTGGSPDSAGIETIAVGKGRFRFPVPTPSGCIIAVLFAHILIFGIRGPAYLAHYLVKIFHPAVPLPSSYRTDLGWIEVGYMVGVWFAIISVCFLAIGVISHFSRRIHVSLRPRGLVIAWVAFLCWYLGMACLCIFSIGQRQLGATIWLMPIGVLSGLWFLRRGAFYFVQARRHMFRDADRAVKKDPRKPIVYLRRFGRDFELAPGETYDRTEKIDPVADHIFLPGFYTGRRHLTFEEVICSGLNTVGPVIAIGAPGETLPPLGACRKYVSDDRWQLQVIHWMNESLFTALVADNSGGLTWEFRRMLLQCDPERMLLLIPSDSELVWNGFTARHPDFLANGILPVRLPPNSLAITFRQGWKPVIITGEPTIGAFRTIARMVRTNARMVAERNSKR